MVTSGTARAIWQGNTKILSRAFAPARSDTILKQVFGCLVSLALITFWADRPLVNRADVEL